MARAVRLSHVESALRQLSYPVDQDSAVAELDDVTLILAEGEVNLGSTIAQINENEFESMDDLESEINNALPREAVGEPYQSEGEG